MFSLDFEKEPAEAFKGTGCQMESQLQPFDSAIQTHENPSSMAHRIKAHFTVAPAVGCQ